MMCPPPPPRTGAGGKHWAGGIYKTTPIKCQIALGSFSGLPLIPQSREGGTEIKAFEKKNRRKNIV